MQATHFVEKINLDTVSPFVPEAAYVTFTDAYLKNGGDFDAAVGKVSTMWTPDVLEKYENAFRIFGQVSGLFSYV